jgi:SAM-dependent methyltransferase
MQSGIIMDETLLDARYVEAGLYDQAEWYDTDYAGYLAENAFYENAIQKCLTSGQTYLELGAGTGRLALRYTQHPIFVHAVEPAISMLERLRHKAMQLDAGTQLKLTTEQACASTFQGPPNRPIGLISFPFNGILHIHGHKRLNRVLQRIERALEPQGYFALDITAPAWTDMGGYVRDWGRLDQRTHPETGEVFLTYDRCVYDGPARLLHSDYRFIKEGSKEGVELRISQYMWTYQEILFALETNGFEIDEIFGDVDFRPWGEQSTRLLVLVQKSDPPHKHH